MEKQIFKNTFSEEVLIDAYTQHDEHRAHQLSQRYTAKKLKNDVNELRAKGFDAKPHMRQILVEMGVKSLNELDENLKERALMFITFHIFHEYEKYESSQINKNYLAK